MKRLFLLVPISLLAISIFVVYVYVYQISILDREHHPQLLPNHPMLLIPQALAAENLFYGYSSFEKLSPITPDEPSTFELKIRYTEGPYMISNLTPVFDINPESAATYVHIKTNPIDGLFRNDVRRIQNVITIDPQIQYGKMFVSVYFNGTDSYGNPYKSSWIDSLVVNIEKQTPESSLEKEANYVKYDLSGEQRFTLHPDIKKTPLPSDIRQSMSEWCADSPSSLKNDPRFWDAMPIRIMSHTSEFQVLQGEADSFVIHVYAVEESCPPYAELVGTFTSRGEDKHRFALSYDGDFFRYQIDETYPLEYQTFAPLKQFKSGIPIEEIKCKENLLLILKHNGDPICVKSHSIIHLNSRGYALGQSCTNTLFLQNNSMTLPCYCKNNESLISGGYYISEDSNIEIKYQRAIINDGFHGWEVEFFNPSEQSEYAFVYAYCREK